MGTRNDAGRNSYLTLVVIGALSVASYNVHQCVGRDGRCDPGRIAAVIGEISADVIGLQEVSSRADGDTEAHQLSYLAAKTGLEAVAGPTLTRGGAQYGNALLTRAPILDVRRLDLSFPGREPRGALDVDLAIRGQPLRVIVTHFGLSAAERRQQANRLLDALDAIRSPLTVLLLDLNEWVPGSRLIYRLNRRLGKVPAPRTFPSGFPLLPLDRIWVCPSETLLTLNVHRTSLSRLASDHLPVSARLKVPSFDST